VVGGRLSRLLIENYDNRASLRDVVKRNPGARIAIFHGVDDGDIPVRMGRELAKEFPFAEFFAIEEADHVSVLTLAKARIIDWMNR
jgi:pimeloyl-ACP methyl ester carboxylesterase